MKSSSILRGGRHCLSRLRPRLPPATSPSSHAYMCRATASSHPITCARFSTAERPQESATASPDSSSSSSSTPPVFKYPKSQDLFERITEKCSKEDVSIIAQEINNILGRTLRQNEFFYRGFGGRKVKGKKGTAGAGADGAEGEAAEAAPAKTTVDLKLAGFDAKSKIKVIKEIRSIAGLGLKEAKEMVESAPKIVQKDLKPEEAQELKAKLEEIGAQIELV